jgi:hypothetical protein
MTHITPSPGGGGFREASKLGGMIVLLGFALLLCFCSLLPAALLLSFVFNALVLGSSLFATMAQEREKRTIDALRLTQLSSLDILLLKSRGELRTWAKGNGLLLGLMLGAGLVGGEPLTWVFSGALALAAGGLLAIAMALAVSTRSETTSSAVVSGWVCKGAWLAGLPLLDQVMEAVFVADGPVHLFRYLDPAWVALRVAEASFFEVSGLSIAGLWIGALASVAVAALAVLQSSRLIDSSFEAAASLDDRARHSAYSKTFPLGLHENPFFVRELAWQMRSGAGRWPGYAVFVTLFLAPFLYGVAQNQKGQLAQPVKVVRQDLLVTAPVAPVSQGSEGTEVKHPGCGSGDTTESAPFKVVRPHSHFCLSRLMGLPVDRMEITNRAGYRSIVTPTGRVEQVSETTLRRMTDETGATGYHDRSSRPAQYGLSQRSYLEYELGRGLLTGLLLTVIYLFVRGGAFMAGAITGEKERRAWDQIALTGVSPDTFVSGKLFAVLAYPLRQMLVASPALALFAVYNVISPLQLVLVLTLLMTCFAAAGALGMAASTLRPTSHEAQGAALGITAGLLLLPLTGWGWVILAGGLMLLIGRTSLSAGGRLLAGGSVVVAGLAGGAAVSPVAAVMSLCGSTLGQSNLVWAIGGASGALLWSALSMAGVAGLFYLVAVRGLETGGSVKA